MTEKRKAAPGVGTGSGREETAAALVGASNSTSTSDFNTAAGGRQGPISQFLLFGQRNAVPLQQLHKLSGMDSRTARRMIEIERRTGTPICSDNQTGYYLAEDAAELAQFIRSMQHRAAEIWKTARALEDTLQRASGQERMEGF